MIKYQFTVRSHIKSEPRITQVKWYVEPFIFKQLMSLDNVSNFFGAKEINEQKKKLCNGILLEKGEYFSDNSLYFDCIGKFVESKEGWYNCKKI